MRVGASEWEPLQETPTVEQEADNEKYNLEKPGDKTCEEAITEAPNLAPCQRKDEIIEAKDANDLMMQDGAQEVPTEEGIDVPTSKEEEPVEEVAADS